MGRRKKVWIKFGILELLIIKQTLYIYLSKLAYLNNLLNVTPEV